MDASRLAATSASRTFERCDMVDRCVNASSGEHPRRSASTPLACSITPRLAIARRKPATSASRRWTRTAQSRSAAGAAGWSSPVMRRACHKCVVTCRGGASGEDAHPTRPDEKADDDEHDAPEDRATEQRHNPGDDENGCDEPEDEVHDAALPGAATRQTDRMCRLPSAFRRPGDRVAAAGRSGSLQSDRRDRTDRHYCRIDCRIELPAGRRRR